MTYTGRTPRAVTYYPGSAHLPWDSIPLGIGTEGEELWNLGDDPHLIVTGGTGSGKSVVQRNIMFHCIQLSQKWQFLGIDLKKVELTPYRKYSENLGIAANRDDALTALRFITTEMKRRYTLMEHDGAERYVDPGDTRRALMLLVDEAWMLLNHHAGETEDEHEFIREANELIYDILRFGPPAGIHAVLATQRTIPPHLLAHCSASYEMGSPTLTSDTRAEVISKGTGVLYNKGIRRPVQSYYADPSWIDSWLEESSR